MLDKDIKFLMKQEETKRKISKSCTGKICKGRSCIKLSIDNVELAEYSRIIDAGNIRRNFND
mgnify:CR=1 FL=1